MTDDRPLARRISPPLRRYRGTVTDPDRWDHVRLREGDVIVCTPAKAGTTWTQTMVAMLLKGTVDLPETLTRISPWIEASFKPPEEVFPAFEAQTGRRVVKSHTPADGIPVWEGVHFVAVARHPLDILLSIRKHIANRSSIDDHPMKAPLPESFEYFLAHDPGTDDVDSDALMSSTTHYLAARSGHWPDVLALNYADMKRDHLGTVEQLNAHLETERDPHFLERVAAASDFGAMKKEASKFIPEGGSGLWRDEDAFFAKGKSGGWRDRITGDQLDGFERRLAELLPDPDDRLWLLNGAG